jgi:hypothetical protein
VIHKAILGIAFFINASGLFETAGSFPGLDAVGERTNFDPVIQGVNAGARINHPQFIQSQVGNAWFFLPNLRPSVVSASYLSQVQVNGAAAVMMTRRIFILTAWFAAGQRASIETAGCRRCG